MAHCTDEGHLRSMTVRKRYRFFGTVQGVGFRPFIFRLAAARGLSGWVQNRHDGVVVEVEGPEAVVNSFPECVQDALPPLARISRWEGETAPVRGEDSFRIAASSTHGDETVLISPDAAICDDCLGELFDPGNRRFRYPFINCTNCGPRLTIINDIPYDRRRTSMACFPLCPQCSREYEDPGDRRFHAEPNACPACGPALRFLDACGQPIPTGDPLAVAIEQLRQGDILAVKGLGGFHLAVDATNDDAVRRLRLRKHREEKPFAVMVPDLAGARHLAELSPQEQVFLNSPERPIVLVRKSNGEPVSPAVAPGMADLGIMLPYTPLHHLLLKDHFRALVMTSGNRTDEPICVGNREALRSLAGIADGYLVHNRDILVRCDDSVLAVTSGNPRFIRRSRGYVPRPLILSRSFPPVLALGAHLKATLCILKGAQAFLSPHIGDLETPQARDFFDESMALMERITECRPEIVAYDLHPAFYSTQVARKLPGRLFAVQHHHAHIVSCLAEHGWSGEVIGLAMDGTGYGTDGGIWGGEFLVANERTFTRLGYIAPFPLAGGERAVKEPWRTAASLLRQAIPGEWPALTAALGLLPPDLPDGARERIMNGSASWLPCTSLGRIFDGIAALLTRRRRISFEGQAAMELEQLAGGTSGKAMTFSIHEAEGGLRLDLSDLIRTVAEEVLEGQDPRALASSFHGTIIAACVEMAARIGQKTGLRRVVLSGGCFQNRILLEGSFSELKKCGFTVIYPRQLPCNDGGISLGQAVCAGANYMEANHAAY